MSAADYQPTATPVRFASATESSVPVTIYGLTSSQAGPNIYNFNPGNYQNARKAIANVRAGIASMNIPCLGDSTTVATDGTDHSDIVKESWCRRTADILTGQGLKSGWYNFMGDYKSNAWSTTADVVNPMLTAPPAGWSLFQDGPGGKFYGNSTNTNALTFTPAGQTDTLDVYYIDNAGYDNFVIKSGAAGATTPSTGGSVTITGTSRIKKATATYTLGANVWTIAKANATATNLFVVAIVASSSQAAPQINFLNCGCASQEFSYFTNTSNFWNTLSAISSSSSALISPLAIINLGINNWGLGTSPATSYADLTTIVTALQAASTDVLLVIPPNTVSATTPLATQQAIVDKIYQVAIEKNCAVFDIQQRWVSAAIGVTNGYYGDNAVHPSIPVGYTDIASGLSKFLLAL